ncbi:Rab geranylgeranyltransferase [Coccidioides posadasii str. Silveira]|uniref:Geranylgeranyl transferase type-2 subunit alpha n=2 Tax=Coccidioides posadasii TaxID=199306 RepID=E9CW85_COCPS|nr:prenyltransferase alpha subunit repeat protein [Coccidioides posadasii str. Silveira]KMM65035.1 geranylgeranyl transferase type II alpha subunit [Coccidioides posadasii RMSCC 3488]QVM07033.1 Rab geranylgeranyltransferase [Coccidioides posadasii str. Silveira]
MTSHGVPRNAAPPHDRTEEARKRERQKIQKYRDLDHLVRTKKTEHDYTEDALKKTSELLTENAEYYSIWNYRRLILQSQLDNISATGPAHHAESIGQLIQEELTFLVPLLRQFPKCYWIWNHRLWALKQTVGRLPLPQALRFWQEELALVGKMLSLDARNFHGWGYRREIVDVLESLGSEAGDPSVEVKENRLTEDELNYTTKMIGANLSNFSAWHNRSKLILKMLDERSADDAERRKMLDNELKLIHRALIDPYDQSLWFYHQNLMCTLDRATAPKGMAPNLSDETRLEYLKGEIDAITELLDEEEDCKWIYQALLECTLIVLNIQGAVSARVKRDISDWLSNLKRLDPLRRGRWEDLERSLMT